MLPQASCGSPVGKDSGGLTRTASLPTLVAWSSRPSHRQLLPPLEVAKSPPMLPVKSPHGGPFRTLLSPQASEHLTKRSSRRTATISVVLPDRDRAPDIVDDECQSPVRRPRRCKTSGTPSDLAAQYGLLAPHTGLHTQISTPISTPGGASTRLGMSPPLSVATPMSGIPSLPSPSSAVCGQEGVAWIRGSRLGSGSYGTVFKAMDRQHGRMFAVKEAVLGDADGKNRERLDVELSICRSLRHPNIVSYLGYEYTSEHLHIFLEYVPGGSMASMLREFGALSDSSLRKATAGMVEGLNYLHTQNPPVVHRDIKAANLLVDLELHVKLADFGCSKFSSDTQSFTTVGSVPWMAPEVMLLEGGHGRKADIWSVGCTVLELATAENPWGKNAFDNIMYAMQVIAFSSALPPIPECLHPDGKEMVSKCLQRIAPERPQAKELLDDPFLCTSRPLTAWMQ